MEPSSELQGIILNISGCAYLTYVFFEVRKKGGRAKKTFLIIISVILGLLLTIADPAGAGLFPAAVAVFHFLFRFLWYLLKGTGKNLQNMTRPIPFKDKKDVDNKPTVQTERQAT